VLRHTRCGSTKRHRRLEPAPHHLHCDRRPDAARARALLAQWPHCPGRCL